MERRWWIAIPILLVLLVLCVAIGVVAFMSVQRLSSPGGLFLYGGSVYDVPAERDDEQAFEVGAPSRLVVENICGAVSVRAAGDGSLLVRAHITAWGKDEADAAGALETIQIDATQEGDTVHVGLKNPEQVCDGRNRRPPTVDFVIQAPAETIARLSTTTGAVNLEGLEGDAELRSLFGEVSARDLTGALLAESDNGAVIVQGIHAGSGDIRLESQFGRIQVEDVQAGTLTVTSRNGGAELRQALIDGATTLSSDFGRVSWVGGQADTLDLSSKNGSLDLEDLELAAGVAITNDFGGVTLRAVRSPSYTVTTKNGPIEIDGATGDVTAHSDFGNVSVRAEGALLIDLASDNGAVTYEGGLGAGESKLRSRFGSIRLLLPKDAAFTFDLETGFGKITSTFPIQIDGEPNENHWLGAVGGGGEATLIASTENGNITLDAR